MQKDSTNYEGENCTGRNKVKKKALSCDHECMISVWLVVSSQTAVFDVNNFLKIIGNSWHKKF